MGYECYKYLQFQAGPISICGAGGHVGASTTRASSCGGKTAAEVGASEFEIPRDTLFSDPFVLCSLNEAHSPAQRLLTGTVPFVD